MPSRRTSRLKSRIAPSKPQSSTQPAPAVDVAVCCLRPNPPCLRLAHSGRSHTLPRQHALSPLGAAPPKTRNAGRLGSSRRQSKGKNRLNRRRLGLYGGCHPLSSAIPFRWRNAPTPREGQKRHVLQTTGESVLRWSIVERFGIRRNVIETASGRRDQNAQTARAPRRRLALARGCTWALTTFVPAARGGSNQSPPVPRSRTRGGAGSQAQGQE